MRKPLVYAVLLALAASPLAACSSAASTPPPAAPTLASSIPSAASVPATTTSAAIAKDSRGFIPKQLGQNAGLTASDGSAAQVMTFAIDKITIDPKCRAYGNRAAGAHTVLLDIRVSTATLAAEDASTLPGLFNPFAFQVYDAEGVSHSSRSDMCTDPAQFSPTAYASNSKYRFQIAFSTDAVPVEIVLAGSDGSGTWGWVWKAK